MTPKFYEKGLRFECTGCGDCCRARHGEPSWVYVTLDERRALAAHLQLPTSVFTRRYCERSNGFFHLRHPTSDCLFLKDGRCSVYAARPGQCRTYPFWREHMSPDAWRKVEADCPGAGHGRVWSLKEIEVRLADEAARDAQA